MQQNLVGLERTLLNLAGFTSPDQRTVDALIGACSDAIMKWCRRDFFPRSYDELYNGDGDRRLLLRCYPVISVESVRYRPVTALKITNTATSQNQRANVSVTSTGIDLVRVASGVPTRNSLAFTSYVTISDMATAITALGNGWSAQFVGDAGNQGGQGDYGLWPSSDLYVAVSYGDGTGSWMSGLSARGAFAEVKLHSYELQGYQLDHRGWLLRAIPYSDPELLHPEDLVWPVGINNFRVQYTAGYSTIPEAVQEACAQWVAMLYGLTTRDPGQLLHLVPGASDTTTATKAWYPLIQQQGIPGNVTALLKPYRRHSIGTNQG